jgi:uncharacterized membrane protein
MNAAEFFTSDQKQLIENAIVESEQGTSAEIRIHVETYFKGNILDRAATVFALLNMHKTGSRNGVLIYLSIENKQFAILGDAGINNLVPENFWNEIKTVMEDCFKRSEFARGLALAVKMAGEQLKEHFPHQKDDINELPNEISFDTSE